MNGKADATKMQVSIASLKIALSEERLNAYKAQGDKDELDAVARYIWNLAIGCAMQPALHALEITFRNHLFKTSRRVVDESKLKFYDAACWLDANPTLLEDAEASMVERAKELLDRENKTITPGRLISKLGFGFWVNLCKSPYEQGRGGPALWPGLATSGFPFMAVENRTRSQIYHRLDGIRELRNRVSHHEPIWDRNLMKSHDDVLDTLSWMNLGFATALRAISPLGETISKGSASYRATAERLVKL